MVVPSMLARGYSKSFTLALIATAGCIGVIIPPSIPMVIYGVSTQNSISDMFLGGFVPGMLVGGFLITWCYYYCKKHGWKGDDTPFSWERARRVGNDAKWALINPVIILGGIYAGVFTPTEAAAVAAAYAFICGVFIHRELNFKTIVAPIASACSTTGTSMAILGCATAFTRIMTIEQIPAMVTAFMIGLTQNKIILLILINILLLIVGCFMDTTPAMIVLSPILLPVAVSLGLHPIHFGLIMVVNLAIGFITPPLGVNLFVATRVGDVPIEVVTRGIIPFVIVMIFSLALITFVPELTMFLPNLLK
jgi:C4-dicarboxylate transporter DctM subunit